MDDEVSYGKKRLFMPMFDGVNCWEKFVLFSALLIIPLAVVIYFIAILGIPFAIVSIALFSVLIKILIDRFGDRMFTDPELYMDSSEIRKFREQKVDRSLFENSD